MSRASNETAPLRATINGRTRTVPEDPGRLLCDFLRHDVGLTGTHVGCGHGVCGACTVLVDGRASRSCLMLAVQGVGREVRTVESLADGEALNELQEAFARHDALQCGFCTAGILMSCTDFLERARDPSEREVREMLSGHLCRCTGYTGMVRAVLEVAAARDARRAGSATHPEARRV